MLCREGGLVSGLQENWGEKYTITRGSHDKSFYRRRKRDGNEREIQRVIFVNIWSGQAHIFDRTFTGILSSVPRWLYNPGTV